MHVEYAVDIRDKPEPYAGYTLPELKALLATIIKNEDYENAVRIRDAIDRRNRKT